MTTGSGQPNSRVGIRSKWKCDTRSAASPKPSASRVPSAASSSRAGHDRGASVAVSVIGLEQRVDERRHAGDFADEDQHADQQQHDDERNQPESLAPPEKREQLANGAGAAGDVSQGFHGGDHYSIEKGSCLY